MRALSAAFFISAAIIVYLSMHLPAAATGRTVVVDTFSAASEGGIPKGWKTFKFPRSKKTTSYSLKEEGGDWFVSAVSVSSASAIYKEMGLNVKDTPILRWRWKVEGVLKKGDETKKEGDDYAARVYVAFDYEPHKAGIFERVKHGLAKTLFGIDLPGHAINYIWANRLKKDSAAWNPFTDKVIMIAVESGEYEAGRWVAEERNVYEDYRRYFNDEEGAPLEPPRVAGVAIMTDSDNTREEARAFYDDITFSAAPMVR